MFYRTSACWADIDHLKPTDGDTPRTNRIEAQLESRISSLPMRLLVTSLLRWSTILRKRCSPMHDALTVGIPVLAILFGILLNQRGLDKLEAA